MEIIYQEYVEHTVQILHASLPPFNPPSSRISSPPRHSSSKKLSSIQPTTPIRQKSQLSQIQIDDLQGFLDDDEFDSVGDSLNLTSSVTSADISAPIKPVISEKNTTRFPLSVISSVDSEAGKADSPDEQLDMRWVHFYSEKLGFSTPVTEREVMAISICPCAFH